MAEDVQRYEVINQFDAPPDPIIVSGLGGEDGDESGSLDPRISPPSSGSDGAAEVAGAEQTVESVLSSSAPVMVGRLAGLRLSRGVRARDILGGQDCATLSRDAHRRSSFEPMAERTADQQARIARQRRAFYAIVLNS